jgi:hypothetical protein
MTRRRFDLIEVVLCVLLVGVVAYQAGHQRGAALERAYGSAWRYPDDIRLDAALAARYGTRHSAHLEEWVVRDFFRDMRGGVFADIGAYHWQDDNNTLTLEQTLGWSGVAVDAVAAYADGWRAHRPRSRFIVAFVDRVDGERRTVDVPASAPQLASTPDNAGMHTAFAAYDGKIDQTHTESATLDTILTRAGITRLDFLSMDIELHEPEALAGFSIDRYAPRLVCIEAHTPVRQQILDYFHRHGYVLVGKYLRTDNSNLWFMPAPSRPQ